MKLVETTTLHGVSMKSHAMALKSEGPRDRQNDDFDDEEFEDELGDEEYEELDEAAEDNPDWEDDDFEE